MDFEGSIDGIYTPDHVTYKGKVVRADSEGLLIDNGDNMSHSELKELIHGLSNTRCFDDDCDGSNCQPCTIRERCRSMIQGGLD